MTEREPELCIVEDTAVRKEPQRRAGDERCRCCRYCRNRSCHRRAPCPVVDAGLCGAGRAGWPKVDPDDWCGEFMSASRSGEETWRLPIEVLCLSTRAKRGLHRAGVQTIGDLASKTERDLWGLRNFGAVTIRELRDKLVGMGLFFGMAVPRGGGERGAQGA